MIRLPPQNWKWGYMFKFGDWALCLGPKWISRAAPKLTPSGGGTEGKQGGNQEQPLFPPSWVNATEEHSKPRVTHIIISGGNGLGEGARLSCAEGA